MIRCLSFISTTRWLRCCAVLVVVTAPAAARAQMPPQDQDRTMQDRLDRVERDLNMLERQVYRRCAGRGGGARRGRQ